MNLVALVAHPDDCIIFAMPFVSCTQRHNWTIVYLTCRESSKRAVEIKKFWHSRNVNTRFLQFEDVEGVPTSWDAASVASMLSDLTMDMVLTHNREGEYGHQHHMFVHRVADFLPAPKVYFRASSSNNFTCANVMHYNLNEIPVHAPVVETFTFRNTGLYSVPEETLGDIKWKKLRFTMWAEKWLRIMKLTFSKITSILKI